MVWLLQQLKGAHHSMSVVGLLGGAVGVVEGAPKATQ
jgi:hypothetical protein